MAPETEVAVDVTPDRDFNEVAIEEESAPVVEGAAEPEEKAAEHPKEEERPKETAPTVDYDKLKEELERERKDKASIAYNLREAERQRKFVEDQLRQERERLSRAALKTEHDNELSKIEHLKDIDSDAYIKERERLIESRYRKEVEQEREAIRTKVVTEESSARRQRVEEKIERDFPELKDQTSVLFMEVRSSIESRYSPEQAAYILTNAPEVMYDIVEANSARLKIKQLESERANANREQRVNGQGAVTAQKKATGTVTLDKDRMDFCRRTWTKSEQYPTLDSYVKSYARFVGNRKG
jgi:hypothetical protein